MVVRMPMIEPKVIINKEHILKFHPKQPTGGKNKTGTLTYSPLILYLTTTVIRSQDRS